MNINLLMSYDEYSKIKHKIPYFYNIESKNQSLYYFGANHSQDPNHPQFNSLLEIWGEFVRKFNGIRTAVMIEAVEIPKLEAAMKEYIIKYGEPGACAYLASQNKSLLVFGEPRSEEIISHLLKEYSKEEILLFFESIALNFWHENKIKTKISMSEFISNHTKKYRNLLNWPDLVISIDFIKEIYKKIFNKELNMDDREIFSQITSPVTIHSRINKLSRSQSLYRNRYILEQIEKYWKEGYNIFVIYGAGHAVMQKPVIYSLVDKNE